MSQYGNNVKRCEKVVPAPVHAMFYFSPLY